MKSPMQSGGKGFANQADTVFRMGSTALASMPRRDMDGPWDHLKVPDLRDEAEKGRPSASREELSDIRAGVLVLLALLVVLGLVVIVYTDWPLVSQVCFVAFVGLFVSPVVLAVLTMRKVFLAIAASVFGIGAMAGAALAGPLGISFTLWGAISTVVLGPVLLGVSWKLLTRETPFFGFR
jgi:hypothetical protein